MSKKQDTKLEFSILKTICASDINEVRSYLLPRLTPKHFATATAQNLFRRITTLLSDSQYVPSWDDLLVDPGVRKETRQAMASVEAKKLRSSEAIKSSYAVLDTYRKIRALYHLGAELEEGLEDSSVDVSGIMENLTKNIQTVIDGSQETQIVNIGIGGNSLSMVKRLLKSGGPMRIPTGFHAFDSVNKGIPLGSFMLIAGTTSGGKSVMASMLSENMAMNGAHVGLIPLEMNAEENIQRNLARIGDEDLSNLIDPENKISDKRRVQILNAYKRYSKSIKNRGGRISIIDPKFEASMENVLEFVKPLGLNVIIIDYVGLLAGVNGDDQWRALSKATAYAKRWAEINGRIVIGLVQLSTDGMIRYSKAMQEHASYAWFWVYDELARETNMISINQPKARMAKAFDFLVKVDFAKMTMRDPTKTEIEEYELASRPGENKSGNQKWKSKKKSNKDEYDDEDQDEKPRKRKKHVEESGKIKKPSNRFEY